MLNIKENKSSFADRQLVMMVKRENNKKRNYLLVDSKQGKHIPANPSDVIKLFLELGEELKKSVGDEKILFIGFAETATAVGAGVASCFPDSYYLHTTRETDDGRKPVVEFKEEHSHAVEQILYCDDWDSISDVDRIIFVEDEITTGKTIMNFIEVLRNSRRVRENMRFSACSILNGMSDERKKELASYGVDFYYLVSMSASPESDEVYSYDIQDVEIHSSVKYDEIRLKGYINPRYGTKSEKYISVCHDLSQKTVDRFDFTGKKVVVVGTEECMYPAIITAKTILKNTSAEIVLTHSTTRSPIVAENTESYPLKTRTQVESLYEENRRTFIYNSRENGYDIVLFVTDSQKEDICIDRLVSAFSLSKNFVLVRWEK